MRRALEPEKSTGVEDTVFCIFYCINFMIEERAPLGLLALQSSVYPSDARKDAWMFQIYYYQ